MTILFWLISLIFAVLLPWGTNVPLQRRGIFVLSLVIVNVAFHLVTQGFIFESHVSSWASVETRQEASEARTRYKQYLDVLALTPSKLDAQGGWRWIQLITANFVHAGWLHLVLNLWVFALYGQNVEDRFGRWRFALFLIAAMIGTQLSTLYLTVGTQAYLQPHRGFSGVVYAVIGAYLVCFPRSRIKVALIYDFKFWAAILFLLIPAISIFGPSSPSLAELMLLLGVVGIFLLLEPEHTRFGIPAFALLGYKLLQDAITLQQQAEHQVGIWGHIGGLLVGVTAGFVVNGTKGLRQTWDDVDALPKPRRREREKLNLARLQAAAQNDGKAARTYLGQRVFVGDADRATQFYLETATNKFPDLKLDHREQLSLARMLHFKGHDAASLRAYEHLIQSAPLPPGFEDAYFAAAKLCHQLTPQRAADALRYLRLFDENSRMTRDKMEARGLREEIVAAAQLRGEDGDALLAASQDVDTSRVRLKTVLAENLAGYTAVPAIPDIPKVDQRGSSAEPIAAGSMTPAPGEKVGELGDASPVQSVTSQKHPGVNPTQPAQDASAPDAGQTAWGKKRLPMKTVGKDLFASANEQQSSSVIRSSHNPMATPQVPPSVERRAGLRRGPLVDLTGLDLPPASIPESPAPEEVPTPTATSAKESLRQLKAKGLDVQYGTNLDSPADVAASGLPPVVKQTKQSTDLENPKLHIIPLVESQSASPESLDTGGQRESVLKAGAEYAAAALQESTQAQDSRIVSQRVYSTAAAPNTSEDSSQFVQGAWLILEPGNLLFARPGISQYGPRLIDSLTREFGLDLTLDAIIGSAGVLQLPVELDSNKALEAACAAGAAATLVHRMPAAFSHEPVEALVFELFNEEILFTISLVGRLRIANADVLITQQANVRLSRRENAPPRQLFEFITLGPVSQRLQLHERTFSISQSKADNAPLTVGTFDAVADLLSQKVGVEKHFSMNGIVGFADHESLLKRRSMRNMSGAS